MSADIESEVFAEAIARLERAVCGLARVIEPMGVPNDEVLDGLAALNEQRNPSWPKFKALVAESYERSHAKKK